jgi:flagellar motility protein MotE (MotC chaperone)
MKSVMIISCVTFLLIFGGISVMSLQLSGRTGSGDDLSPADAAAGQRLLSDVSAERDRLQREREYLAGLHQSQAAREVVMGQVHQEILGVIGRLETQQEVFIEEQEVAATRLAKMYEAMKPDQAAQILSAMDMEVILEIMTRMNERAAAKIMANMDAMLAAQISTRLSTRGDLQ